MRHKVRGEHRLGASLSLPGGRTCVLVSPPKPSDRRRRRP